MARLVIGAVGAYVGWLVAGPTGAAYGWSIGMAIGGAFEPAAKSRGPRLEDLNVTGAEPGQPIPYLFGTRRMAGQAWWASPRRELAVESSAGKGGGGVEHTAFVYEQDILIGLTDNVIGGVSRVWNNGKLVYTSLASASVESLQASAQTDLWTRMTVYTGDPAQLPDPTYEAAVGVGNAPAYRHRGSVFIEGLQLGGPPATLPNLTFEVWTLGTVEAVEADVKLQMQYDDGTMADESSNEIVPTILGGAVVVGNRFWAGGGEFGCAEYTSTALNPVAGEAITIEGLIEDARPVDAANSYAVLIFQCQWTQAGAMNLFIELGGAQFGFGARGTRLGSLGTTFHTHYPLVPTFHSAVVVTATGAVRWYIDGVLVYTGAPGTISPESTSGSTLFRIGNEFTSQPARITDVYVDLFRLKRGEVYTANFTPPTSLPAPDLPFEKATLLNDTIANVVSALCLRAGLTAAQVDVTALASITKPVRGYAISQIGGTRAALEQLAAAYFFECVVSDKVYFRPRGGASVASIPYVDIGASSDPVGQSEPLPLKPGNELELPAQIAVTFSNVVDDYQNDTQYSDRLLTGGDTVAPVQLPIAFTASEGKAIADSMVMDQIASLVSTKLCLLANYSRLEPTDVVVVTGADGSTYRLRLVKKQDAQGVLEFEAVIDDASVLSSQGITSADYTPQTTVATPADTVMELMDIPILRDADNDPGFYVAANSSEDVWPGAAIYSSRDDVTFGREVDILERAVFGICSTVLGDWTARVFDETNTVTVSMGDGTLASSTRDALLNDQTINAILIGSEVLQFRTAALLSAGIYTLSGLLRGARGTEWAMTGHAASERCVLLRPAGMRRTLVDTAGIGVERYYKGVTLGRRLSTANSEAFTDNAVGLKPFSPFDLRASRVSGDINFTWQRRTRLAVRTTGALGISIPLGEDSQAYEVDIYSDGTYTTVVRTLTSTTTSVAYSSAQQTTDHGSPQAIVYAKVFQMSEHVGRGYELRAAA